MTTNQTEHIPVLLNEAIEGLSIKKMVFTLIAHLVEGGIREKF